MKEALLQKLGLTELESSMYLQLLEVDHATTGEMAKKLRIQRSTAYYIMESLQRKGLVVFFLRGKRRLYQASSPYILERHALETYQKIKEALPTLLQKIPAKEKDEALLFVGYKGLRAAYEQMLAESKAGDEFLVLGARGGEDISSRTYRTFYKNFNRRRIQKKITQRVLMNKDLKETIGQYYTSLKKTTVKYLPQKTYVPIVIFPHAVAIVQWKDEPSLFLLKGSLVVASFRQYFESIWRAHKSEE